MIIFICALIFFLLIVKKYEKSKLLLWMPLSIVILAITIVLVCEKEEYIQIVNKNDELIKVQLENRKEYYGHSFYRFSTSLSEEDILESIQDSYSSAYYDEKQKKIIFDCDGISYMIVKEKEESWLWNKKYSYLFSENE